LQKGVGIFVSDLTTTPDGNGHTILSGHRDTVFSGLDKVGEGNTLIVKYTRMKLRKPGLLIRMTEV
jgi:sortase A